MMILNTTRTASVHFRRAVRVSNARTAQTVPPPRCVSTASVSTPAAWPMHAARTPPVWPLNMRLCAPASKIIPGIPSWGARGYCIAVEMGSARAERVVAMDYALVSVCFIFFIYYLFIHAIPK